MNKNISLFSLIIFSFSFLVSCNATKIVDQDYEKVTLYVMEDNKYEKVSELRDKEKIKELADLINKGKREDPNVSFEKGPDGLLVFEKKDEKFELPIFTDSGNIYNKKYYVTCNIDMRKYFGANW